VFVGIAAWLLHRERPGVRAFVTIPIVFTGVVLISGLGRPDAHGVDPIAGTVYGAIAGVCYAVFLLMFRASNRVLAPSAGPLLDATIGAALGALVWGSLDGSLQFQIGWSAHAWLLVLAIVPHVGGWLLISAALPRLPALDTSVLLLLQPMATVLWGLLIFGEWLSTLQWSGVGLILGGIAWLSMGGTSAQVPDEPSRADELAAAFRTKSAGDPHVQKVSRELGFERR
jgi:drug/metabolite transporter (DMT)-like permease